MARWAEANGAKAWLLGVQPESLKPAQRLTETVEATLEALGDFAAKLQADRRSAAGAADGGGAPMMTPEQAVLDSILICAAGAIVTLLRCALPDRCRLAFIPGHRGHGRADFLRGG